MLVVIAGAFYYKYSNHPFSQDNVLSYDTSGNNSEDYATSSKYIVDINQAFNNPASSDTDNVSDRFAQLAVANYMNLQSNGATDDEAAQGTVDNLATQASLTAHTDAYTTADIKTFSDTDKVAVKNYGNAFAKIENDTLGLISKNKAKYQNDLSAIAVVYESTSKKLLLIPAPQSIAGLHVQEINYLHNMSLDFQDLVKDQNDPVKNLLDLNQLESMQGSGGAIYTGISNYFKTNGIIFTKDEPGYKWISQ